MEMETVAELRRKLGAEEVQRSELQGKAAEIQAWRAVAEEQASRQRYVAQDACVVLRDKATCFRAKGKGLNHQPS